MRPPSQTNAEEPNERTTEPLAGRLFDLGVSALGLCALSPALAVGAVAIVVDDGLPIFFPQERVGHGRRSFRLVKLRTMRDGKITRVGKWLRATGVDEVPQFWNVFRGEMSVVGPRPLTAAHVARLGWDRPAHDGRFSVKPGVTGPVQVLGAVSAADSERVEGAYLARRSLGLDLLIVAASSAVLVFGRDRVHAKTRAAFERVMARGERRATAASPSSAHPLLGVRGGRHRGGAVAFRVREQ